MLYFVEHCNSTTEFTCNNYDCVPIQSRCNGVYDCDDRSDEYSCCEYKRFRGEALDVSCIKHLQEMLTDVAYKLDIYMHFVEDLSKSSSISEFYIKFLI